MYVACTRAKDELALIVPGSVYNRFNNCREPAVVSPFVAELPDAVADRYTETYTGGLRKNDEKLRPGLMTRDDGYLPPVVCPEPPSRPAAASPSAGARLSGPHSRPHRLP